MSAAGLGTDWGAGRGGSGAFVWAIAAEPIRAQADRIAVRFIGSGVLVFVAGATPLPNSLGTVRCGDFIRFNEPSCFPFADAVDPSEQPLSAA